jgi:hypothetical protein
MRRFAAVARLPRARGRRSDPEIVELFSGPKQRNHPAWLLSAT